MDLSDRPAFSPKCFAKDHVARTREGLPIGQVVLREDHDLDKRIGQDLEVSIFNIPRQFEVLPRGLVVWIDEFQYIIPKDLDKQKVKVRGNLLSAVNFVMKVVEDEG